MMFTSAAGGGGGEDRGGTAAVSTGGGGGGGIMLFGVRLMEEGTFRKSASMNNLALFEQQPHESNVDDESGNPGYASDDVVHPSARCRERKRGVPWTEEEHKLFLIGLQKVGKGDWRGISRNFVKSRTPTQVASHAQKYFLRRNNSTRRRRRSSLFDITTDAVISGSTAFEDGVQQECLTLPTMQQQNLISNLETYPMSTLTPVISPATGVSPMEGLIKGQQVLPKSTSTKIIRPVPVIPIPPTSKMANLSLKNTMKSTMKDPSPLSLKISPSSSPSSSSEKQTPPRHTSAFQAMPSNSFDSSGGDSIISVA